MMQRTVITLVLAGILAGCGEDVNSASSVESPEGIEIIASAGPDRRIGSDLKKYMVRNCPGPGYEIPDKAKSRYLENHGQRALDRVERQFEDVKAFCSGARSIEVRNSRITVRSDLVAGEAGVGEAFCMIVRGSDVADQTPFHTLLDMNGGKIKVCGTHNAYR